jgi:hypothetical protein
MQKVLPGASREAIGFITSHWKELVKMSAIPALVYIALSYIQLSGMSSLYRNMASMFDGQTVDPGFFSAYMRFMGVNMVFALLGGALMTSLFVQLIRFQKFGQSQWLLSDKAGWKATGMVFVYALGIMMLTMVAYVVVVLGAMIVAMILGALLVLVAGTTAAGVVGSLIAIVAAFGFLSFLLWFMFRFLVGLPGVALGSSPDFFKDMWTLSKGESWGLPLRVLLASLVFYIPLALIMALALVPMFQELINNPAFQPGNDNPAIVFPLMADMMDRMKPFIVVLMLIYMPFIWFVSLLLGTAFQRFRGRQAV